MNPGTILLTMTVGFCFVILGTLLWFALKRRLAADKARHELQIRLLQSVGSAADFGELMRSEEGRALIDPVQRTAGLAPQAYARRYALRAVTAGVVLVFVGAGMSILAATSNRDWLVGAALAVTGGLGLLGSAAGTIWLSRRFGREA